MRVWIGSLTPLLLLFPHAPVALGQDASVVQGVDGGLSTDAGTAGERDSGSDPLDVPLPEAHRPQVTMDLQPHDRIYTGDLVHLTIAVSAVEGDDVTVPAQTLGTLEVHDRHARVEAPLHGRQRFVFELGLLAMEPGDTEIPALRLRVVTRDGTVGGARTAPRRVHVISVIGNTPHAQPKPPTDPVPVFEKNYTLLWVLGALGTLLVTALLTFLFARWWLRRKKPLPPPPPPRPPWEVAIEALEKVRREQPAMLAEQRERELVDRVSDAIRLYLGERYGFDGLESTTDEIVSHLKKRVRENVPLKEVIAFLGDSDLVKFAKLVPGAEECDSLLASAFQLVRTTLPAAQPPTSAAGSGRGTGGGQSGPQSGPPFGPLSPPPGSGSK